MKKQYTSKRGKPVPFELDGVTFTTSGSIPLLHMTKVAGMLGRLGPNGELDLAHIGDLGAVNEFFEAALGPKEYARFFKHVTDHGTDMETLAEILVDLFEEEGGEVPTPRLPESSTGPAATPSTYKVISPSGEVRYEPLTSEREAELRAAVAQAMTG